MRVTCLLFYFFCFVLCCAGTTIVIEKAATDLFVECDKNLDVLYDNFLDSHGGAIANSSCSEVSWYNGGPCELDVYNCYYSVLVQFIATDTCGSYAQTNATFTFADQSAPTVVVPPTPIVIPCSTNTQDDIRNYLAHNGFAIFADSCSSFVIMNSYYYISSGESETIYFTATDSCANSVITSAVMTLEPCY